MTLVFSFRIFVTTIFVFIANAHQTQVPSIFLPIIDLLETDEQIASKLYAAAVEYGIFYVINHNISTDLQMQMMDECRAFFDLDLEIKHTLMRNATHHGYTPLQTFAFDRDSATEGDMHEGMYVGDDTNDNYGFDIGYANQNQLPSSHLMPNMKHIINAYLMNVRNLANTINEFIALSLKLPRAYFHSNAFFGLNPESLMRCIHYPPFASDIENGKFSAGAHSDWGMTTFLITDGNQGLQIKRRRDRDRDRDSDDTRNADTNTSSGDEWLSVAYLENAYVVNVGDELQRWTNDLFFSAKHRVIITADNDRFSIPYFWGPNLDCVVKCLPGLCRDADHQDSDKPVAKYVPITHSQWLIFKMNQAYSYNPTQQIKNDL